MSSYAYILMTLHFLQQRDIIPVLQEIGLEYQVDRIVDNWNTWFFDDMEKLPSVWPEYNKRKSESLGELFLQFLRYYAEEFNFNEYIICCRRKKLLMKLDKMWTRKKIGIEGNERLRSLDSEWCNIYTA